MPQIFINEHFQLESFRSRENEKVKNNDWVCMPDKSLSCLILKCTENDDSILYGDMQFDSIQHKRRSLQMTEQTIYADVTYA